MSEYFLDTSYAIALSVVTDEHHARAVELAEQLEAQQAKIITTRAVLMEIGNALARHRYRGAAVQMLEALDQDPQVECVSVTDDLYQQSFELFRSRPDKEWGLIDCVSFTVMIQRGLTEALTADVHFDQAGLVALLKTPTSM